MKKINWYFLNNFVILDNPELEINVFIYMFLYEGSANTIDSEKQSKQKTVTVQTKMSTLKPIFFGNH